MRHSFADVVVVGAGPAGLLLTTLLSRSGVSATLVDGQEDPARNPQPVMLHPASLDILRNSGVLDPDGLRQGRIRAIEEYGPDGHLYTARYADLPGNGDAFAVNLSQGELRRALLDSLSDRESVRTVFGAEAVEVTGGERGACEIIVGDPAGHGEKERIESTWLVAADGKFSAVRTAAGIPTSIEAFDHDLTVVPTRTPDGYPEIIRLHRGPDLMVATVPGGLPGLTLCFVFSRKDADGLEALLPGTENLIRTWDRPLADSFATTAPVGRTIGVTPHLVSPETWRRDGVILLGDSAHAMHNLGGQGLNTSLHDAVLLASAIIDHKEERDPARIDAVEGIRRSYVTSIQKAQRELCADFWPGPGTGSWYEDRFEELALGQREIRSALAGVNLG